MVQLGDSLTSHSTMLRAACAENAYLRKHQRLPLQILGPPSTGLGMVIVIPCFDEAGILGTLECLWACVRPSCDVEIIVVVNASEAAPRAAKAQNQRTAREVTQWITTHRDARLQFHLLIYPDLPKHHAGVGLARKLGMDEAVGRFTLANNRSGVIVSLDADCRCDSNYLHSIAEHFETYPESPGCSIYFEHSLQGTLGAEVYDAVARYELFLRYYNWGLRFSGHPHAYYTVGSCMAVRTSAYESQGGMNRRRGGEDFYFLQKIIQLGAFSELRQTRVIPSSRASRRVPFGTGQAVSKWLADAPSSYLTYAPNVFRDLEALFSQVQTSSAMHESPTQFIDGLPAPVKEFLSRHSFPARLLEIQGNTASHASFQKRFFRWFNAFRALKYIHWASDHVYARVAIEEAAAILLRWTGLADVELTTQPEPNSLLAHYRYLDRNGRLLRRSNF